MSDGSDGELAGRATEDRLRRELGDLRRDFDAERELRNAVIDHAPDYIVHCGLDRRIRFANRVAKGMRYEEVIGADALSFTPAAFQQAARDAFTSVVATGQPTELEVTTLGDHAPPTHFHVRIAPVRDPGGRITSIVMFASNIDRLKAAEREARDRDARLRLVLEASQVAVCEVDLQAGEVLDLDTRFRELAELPDVPVPFPLVRLLELAHPDDLRLLVETIQSLRTAGSYRQLEFRMVRRSTGEVRWLRGTGKLRTDVPGVHFVAGLEDITQDKLLHDQVAEAVKLESIGRLAGGVAHDFNNLLTVVMAAASMAERKFDAGAPAREELADIRLAAQRGAALTSQLLAFARRQVIAPRVLSLSSLVADVERMLSRILGEDIAITTVFQATGYVRVDPHQLEQVLVNLATNARDAMPRGGKLTIETADVELDAAYVAQHAYVVPGPYVMLAMSDTGTGMTPETLRHVFEPFYTTKGLAHGTGLGLATSHGIIRQAGGFIQVYSELGHGTSFRIYLPRVDAEPERPAPPVSGTFAPATETVLLVEDDEMIHRVVVEALRDFGYAVLDARTADEALQIARTHAAPIDILITDVVMPGMGGRELVDRFVALRPDTVVLFVSGYTENAIVHHGVLDAGVHFLQKPFAPDELDARIRELLAARKR